MTDYILFLVQILTYFFYKNYIYFFVCVVGLCLLTKSAKYLGLIDHPNHRSSHTKPTPSGGGLVIVFIILLFNLNLIKTCPEFFFGSLIIAAIGLKDDIKPVPAMYRLLVQIIAVGSIIILLPLYNPIRFIPISIFKTILFFAGIWFINIYNFMDGIDGLAGGYATAASIGFLYCIQNVIIVEEWNLRIYVQLIYVTLPFLVFNWYPAKIFMGDTGSTFIGFIFFSLGARALIYGNNIMYAFAIIMSFFWLDATITIFRRFLNGKNILQAHKEHAFQKATYLFGHWKVSCFMILVTMFWLTPMARLAVMHKEWDNTITAISVLPVLAIIEVFKPGMPVGFQGPVLRFLTLKFKGNIT